VTAVIAAETGRPCFGKKKRKLGAISVCLFLYFCLCLFQLLGECGKRVYPTAMRKVLDFCGYPSACGHLRTAQRIAGGLRCLSCGSHGRCTPAQGRGLARRDEPGVRLLTRRGNNLLLTSVAALLMATSAAHARPELSKTESWKLTLGTWCVADHPSDDGAYVGIARDECGENEATLTIGERSRNATVQ
jgi:hypothetical protein